MSKAVKLSMEIVNLSHAHDLTMAVTVDRAVFFNHAVSPGKHYLVTEFIDQGDHSIIFELSNKTAQHTQISDSGEIISDSRLTIQNVKFDDIVVDKWIQKYSKYLHDHNGTGSAIEDSFFGEMGCNGQVIFDFSSPFYLWLLSHH